MLNQHNRYRSPNINPLFEVEQTVEFRLGNGTVSFGAHDF
ncbi:MAG: hypothetical protein K5787_06230 [Lentisphaeria bacterium]|nr:hypothetical protein [Lentisphaeria bacterium]